MRALSLSQPWAWLVVHGGKNIENRTWNTKFRGTFLIHATKTITQSEYDRAYAMARNVKGCKEDDVLFFPRKEDFQLGGIIGMATIVDVIQPTDKPTVPWHMVNQYGFVLKDVKPLPFYPCKGLLNFWGNWDVAWNNGKYECLPGEAL